MKSAVRAILLLFVAASIAYLIVGETRTPPGAATVAPTSQPAVPKRETASDADAAKRAKAVAYYFHGTMRCSTCLKMERYAREAIDEAFGPEIDAGLVEWRSIDYDEPANQHFVEEYGLTASALVLVAGADTPTSSSRNLDRVWDLVNDEVAFKEYVVDALRDGLRGGP